MKLSLLKFFKKDKLPSIDSLQSRIFKIEFLWFVSLCVGFLVFVVMVFVGVRIWYSQYFETYKQAGVGENIENIINVAKLKNIVEEREVFINEKISIPTDPSF